MNVNSLFLIILALSTIGGLAIIAVSLKWGLKLLNVAEISLLKAFGLYLVFIIAGLLIALILGTVIFAAGINPPESTLNIIGFAAQYLVSCFVIVFVYQVRLWRAAVAILPYYATPFAMALFAICILRPYIYEAFSIPTNAMAPTLLGEHLEATCPRCGSPAYGSPPDSRNSAMPDGVLMICSKELKSVFVKDPPQARYGGDWLLACKLLKPKRWDLIVFRYPKNPSENYVKRLVGLPGEKLAIHDGAVWINGEKLEPPPSISGIHYSPTIEMNGQVFSGPGSVPVELGPDEYFVLGDFVDSSADSRMWEQGAPGHPPYAVPESYIVGVVINVYWPPNRWASFR